MFKTSIVHVFVTVLLGAGLMSAQASRTWVSGVGDDANPCSRTAPCKTFAGAISKTAPGGEIDALDPGGFGALTITKSITLDGGGGQVASVLVAGTNGIVVQAAANDIVIIRNLRLDGLRGAGNTNAGINGIKFNSGAELHIENCYIFGFNNAGIEITPTTASKVFVDNTVSEDNAFAGMRVQGTGVAVSADVYQSRFMANGIHGLFSSDNSFTTVYASDASGNGGDGFVASANAGTATLTLLNSNANNNGTGVQAGSGTNTATVFIGGSTLNNNGTGFVTASNGTIRSLGNNMNTGTGTPGGTPIGPQ
jgi:hypothetical protein